MLEVLEGFGPLTSQNMSLEPGDHDRLHLHPLLAFKDRHVVWLDGRIGEGHIPTPPPAVGPDVQSPDLASSAAVT